MAARSGPDGSGADRTGEPQYQRRSQADGFLGAVGGRIVGMQGSPTSRAAIAADLRRLGLAGGEVVMVDASLRAFGPVAGGADGVIDALEAVLGTGGTMLLLSGARDDQGWVNQQPESERVALLADRPR